MAAVDSHGGGGGFHGGGGLHGGGDFMAEVASTVAAGAASEAEWDSAAAAGFVAARSAEERDFAEGQDFAGGAFGRSFRGNGFRGGRGWRGRGWVGEMGWGWAGVGAWAGLAVLGLARIRVSVRIWVRPVVADGLLRAQL